MKYVQAIVSLGLFGWFGYALLTGQVAYGDGGSAKTRRVTGMITDAINTVGVETTAYACFAVGILLAICFLLFGSE